MCGYFIKDCCACSIGRKSEKAGVEDCWSKWGREVEIEGGRGMCRDRVLQDTQLRYHMMDCWIICNTVLKFLTLIFFIQSTYFMSMLEEVWSLSWTGLFTVKTPLKGPSEKHTHTCFSFLFQKTHRQRLILLFTHELWFSHELSCSNIMIIPAESSSPTLESYPQVRNIFRATLGKIETEMIVFVKRHIWPRGILSKAVIGRSTRKENIQSCCSSNNEPRGAMMLIGTMKESD